MSLSKTLRALELPALAYGFKAVNFIVAFALIFFGVPLPIPNNAPQPLRMVKEMVEVPEAIAEQLKAVKRGSLPFLSADVTTLEEAPLSPPISIPGSFAIIAGGGGTDDDTLFAASHHYGTGDTLSVVRSGKGKNAGDAVWQVVEFSDGVTVYKSLSTLSNAILSKTVTLATPVDQTKSFPFIAGRAYGPKNKNVNNFLVRTVLQTPVGGNWTELLLDRGKATAKNSIAAVEWQVVEIDAANVQSGTFQMASSTTVVTRSDPTDFASVNEDTSFLIVTFKADPTNQTVDAIYVRGVVSGDPAVADDTTLTFTRWSGNNTVGVSWYLVEMTDGTTVQRGSASMADSVSTTSATLPTAVNVAESFSLVSISSETDKMGSMHVMHDLTGTTTLAFSRYGNIKQNDIAWQVVTLPPVQVTTPNGGETLLVGDTTQNITWNNSDQVNDVKLEFSTNAFSDELETTTIVATTLASAGSYNWNPIPDSLGTNVKIRITDVTTGAPAGREDVSDAPFSIKGSVDLTVPDGAELWFIGDTNRTITWSYTGTMSPATVTLSYSTNSSAGPWTEIATGVAIDDGTAGLFGSYLWNPGGTGIPDLAYQTMQVKIVADADSTVLDTSLADFEIRPNVTLEKPTDADQWPVGRCRTIQWTTTGTISNVDLYFKVGVENYASISANEAGFTGDGTNGCEAPGNPCASGKKCYDWTPAPTTTQGTTAKMKIEMTGNAAVVDEGPDAGDGFFSIVSSIDITSPTTGTEKWKVGTGQTVTFTIGGNSGVDKVDIWYSSDASAGPPTWSLIGDDIDVTGCRAAPPCNFSWPSIPDDIGSDVKVKVEDYIPAAKPFVYDLSDNAFSINGNIDVTKPNATPPDDVLRVGTAYNIQWTNTGNIYAGHCGSTNCLEIRLSMNGGTSYPTVIATGVDSTAGAKSYNWNAPLEADLTVNGLIKVWQLGNNDVAGISDAFKVRPELKTVFPDGGETYAIGDTVPITWDVQPATLGTTVALKYDTNSGNGADGIPNNADDYPSTITCTEGVRIASDKSCSWVIPDADLLYTTDRIKVELVGEEAAVNATSVGNFTVNGAITLTYPSENGADPAQTWLMGEQKNVTWTFSGASLGLVKLYYTKDNGVDLYSNVIFDETATINATAQAYLWTIPDSAIGSAAEINTQIGLKLVTQNNANVNSISAQPVTIKARFTNLVPDTGVTWAAGDTGRSVTWQTNGDGVAAVNCKYSTDGGTTFGGSIASNLSNAGGCAWSPSVNAPVENDIRYRVESFANPSLIYIESSGDNTVKGAISVTSPTSSNVVASSLRVTDPHTITWVPSGDPGTVNIYFAADGATWGSPLNGAPVAATDGNFTWTSVPDVIDLAADEKIKIECVTAWKCDASISGAFNIKGKLDLTVPDGGEVFYVGGADAIITWKPDGTLGNLDISYDTNEGKGADNIAGNADDYPNAIATVVYNVNTGCTPPASHYCYSWPTPSAGTKYRIKVAQVSDTENVVLDSSIANFVVKGNVILNLPGKNPASPEVWTVDGPGNNVSWSVTGGIATVDIHLDAYSGDGVDTIPSTGDEYATAIVTGLSATASPYTWTIPTGLYVTVTTDNARVRVKDATDPTVVATSTNDFKVKPVLNLTAPVAGDKWYMLTTYNITWDAPKGDVANVKVEYSIDGGTSWVTPSISDSVPATNLQFPWAPAAQATNPDTVVRISKVGDAETKSDSAQFNIFADFLLTGPSAQSMPIATTETITWTPIGNPGDSRLQYSIDGGTIWLELDSPPVDIADPVTTTSFNWTVADNPSPDVLVKIYDKTYPNDVVGISPLTNSIIGSIFMVSPDPTVTDNLIAGNPYTIEWTKNGAITNFKIEYHDGTSWNLITANTTDYPTYNWPAVDDNIGTGYKFKVSDFNNPSVFGETNAVHTVKGSINLTSPIGGETVTVGQAYTIKWTKTGTIGNIKVEYSKDNFVADVRTITGSYASAGCQDVPAGCPNYVWTPTTAQILTADMNAEILKIRLTSLGGVPVTDQSTNAFKAVGQVSNVTPSGGAYVWEFGGSRDVTWDQIGNIATVDLNYKTSAGAGFTKTLATGVAAVDGANTVSVTVPDENTEDGWVQVVDSGNAGVNAASAVAFSIRPKITVTTPVLDSNTEVGSSTTAAVQWSIGGSTKVNPVNVVYSLNGGGDGFPNTIATNILASVGQVDWNNVADTLTGDALVKVVDTVNTSVLGLSPSFDIIGKLTVDTPASGVDWAVGTTQTILFTPTGTLGTVNLYYYHDAAYELITTLNSDLVTSHPWLIPLQVEESTTVKVCDADTEGTADEVCGVSALFNLIGGFTFNPQPPATLSAGSSTTIAWDRVAPLEITTVKLEVYDGAAWRNIDFWSAAPPGTDTGLVTNSGTYPWDVPTNVTCINCQFRLSDPDNVTPTTELSTAFEIRALISVTAPLAVTKWTIGTGGVVDVVVDNFIDWNITGTVANVKIEYSSDGGTSYGLVIIASQPAGTKPYDWAIPDNVDILTPTLAMIKVSDASLPVVYDESPAFMVKGGITVTSPVASEVLTAGVGKNIAWTTLGTADHGTVDLMFSKTGAAPWTAIASVPYSSTPYTLWAPANGDLTSNAVVAKIRVEDQDFAVSTNPVYGDSGAFEVEGTVTLDAPNTSNIKWVIGGTEDIKWTPVGTYANVKLEYAKDYTTNGWASPVVIATVLNTASGVQGTYSWVSIPAAAQNDDLRVRVSDDVDPDVNDFSAFSLQVLPGITVLAPQSGEVWYKGDVNKTISWTTGTGVVTNVKVEYKTSAAGSYTTIVLDDGGHVSAGANSYTWALIPDEKTEDAYVRVSDVAHLTDVLDVGDAAFSIRPQITVTAPVADQNVEVGSSTTAAVQWNVGGSAKVTLVDVKYNVDGGAFDKTICIGVLASTGQCDWNGVLDTMSGNAVVQIVDSSISPPANANVVGLSPSFDIIGKLVVATPASGVDWTVGTTQTILFTPTGTLGTVNLYYYHDAAYDLITTVDSDLVTSYNWPIPLEVEESTTVKVCDVDTEGTADEVCGVSAAFNLIGGFTFNPQPPATLNSGSSTTISWDRVGPLEITTAKLEFYNGTAWVNIDFATTNTGLVTNSGSYPWDVPSNLACINCQFRLSDPDNVTPTTEVSTAFEIRALLSVTAPLGTAKWTIGTGGVADVVVDNFIDWNITGVVANVKIEYSSDGGTNYAPPNGLVVIASQPAGTKPYDWAIPDTADILTPTQAMIKVSDASLPVVYDESPAFMVKGGITVTSPAASEVLTAGVAKNITWTTLGTADHGTVDLMFSKTGSAPWTAIASVPYTSTPYTLWAPANGDLTSNAVVAKIRVEDQDFAASTNPVYGDSGTFEVEGTVTMDAPNTSNIKWTIAGTEDIKWTPVGTFANVKLEYAKDYATNSWTTPVTIATVLNTASGVQGTYSWVSIPAAAQNDDLRVRVSDDVDPDVNDFSAFSLQVLPGITVLAPQSGEVWYKGDVNKTISWTTGTGVVTNVKVEYKTSAAGAYATIVLNDAGHVSAGANSYTWLLIPDEKTEDAYVRVSDVAHLTDVLDVGNAAFSIRPRITVTAPVADQNVEVGSSTTAAVQWNVGGSAKVTLVDVKYNVDGGAFDKTICTGVLASTGQCDWNGVLDTLSGNAVVKVLDSSISPPANANVFGLSPSIDIIGKLAVAQPIANANWRVGTTQTILFTPTGTLGTVNLYYYHDAAYELITTLNSDLVTSHPWLIPLQVEESTTVKVCDVDTEGTADEVCGVSALFNLIGGFTFNPQPPATLSAGGSTTIAWDRVAPLEITTVKLEVYDGAAWRNIDFWSAVPPGTDTGLVTNSGTYPWDVPTNVACEGCQFRLSDPGNPTPTTELSSAFEIRAVVAVTAPVGTEKWTIGTGGPLDTGVDNFIDWNITGVVTNVKIEYSSDGGLNYDPPNGGLTITSSQPAGTKPYDWAIPDNANILTSNQGVIRVSDASKPVAYGVSPAFMVKGAITAVTSPTLGNALTVGIVKNIGWTLLGTADYGALNLMYSKTGIAPWTTITSVAYNTSPYTTWAPGDGDIASAAKIRVEDADNPAEVYAESGAFSVGGVVTITAPASGTVWIAGNPHNIVWNRTGSIGVVSISYSVNDGVFTSIATGVTSPTPTGNTFSWTLPSDNIVSTNVNVKIDGVSLIGPDITPDFTVQGNLTLTYPDAANISLTLGDSLNVTWSTAGDIGLVKVEYSEDGVIWQTVTTTAPQGGPQVFALDTDFIAGLPTVGTTVATASAKVRISDADDSTVSATSANAFTVKPLLAVTSPAGGETWVVGSSQSITWNYKATNVTNVKIEYSKDSFVSSTVLFAGSTANDGTEPWTIPDDIQPVPNLKLKISSLPLTDLFANTAISNGNFQIVGALEMVQPDDTTGIKWRVGSSGNEVRWNATGSIINAKLDYSVDSGTNWTTLVASTPSGAGLNKSYSWTIPSATPFAKDTVRIRALDAANTNIFDIATALSSFLADFTFTAPVAGNVWVAETSNDITWTTPAVGVPATVKLEYALDGVTWQLLPENDGVLNDGIVTNSGSRSWTLGPGLATNAKVRVSDPADPDSLVTGNAFKIRGSITVTAPNTGQESWEIETTNAITWTKQGSISAVKLQITTDADAPTPVYNALVDGNAVPQDTQNIDVTGPGPTYTFNWKIADVAGITTPKARIRVMDANDATVYDTSNANFTVRGRVSLTNPNGGGIPQQTLTVGNAYTVDGTVFGPITSVKLFYSTDGVTYPNPLVGCATVTVVAGAFSCAWSVPDQIGTTLKVRVEDAGNVLVFDISDGTFAINGSATLTAPASGTIWIAGNSHDIIWNRNGTIGNVDLFYSVNGGPDTSIASAVPSPLTSGNTFAWTLPSNNIVSANVKVTVDGTNLTVPFVSPSFTVKGNLTLTYPDAANISLTLGDSLSVTWNVAGDIGPVKVEYSEDGVIWQTVTTTAPQGGPQAFALDTDFIAGLPTVGTTVGTVGAKVRISDADDGTVTDTSANAFTVKPLLAVTSPAGGETWVVGSSQSITWNYKATNVINVKIEYSKDSFVSSTVLFAGSTANDGTEPWTIPDDIQPVPNLKLKISSLPLTDLFANTAISNGNFQIIGALEMVQPDDTTGIKWRVGSSGNEVRWNATGSIINAKLEYSVDSGTNWTTLVASTPSGAGLNKSYSWTIPSATPFVKDTVRIRALDAANTNVSDIATALSSFLADFTITAPVAGNVWVASTSNDITWTVPALGVPATVKLEYALDGVTWQLLPENDGVLNDGIVTNSGTRSWTLGSGLSTNAKVRISDPGDPDSLVTGNAFKIRGDLTVTSPNTGQESWEIETPNAITWTKLGNITAVKLQITTDADAPTPVYNAVVDGNAVPQDTQNIDVTGPGPTYTFNWKIADVAGITTTKARIRVMDANDATVYDTSNANFTIKGRVMLTNPNGGGTLAVGAISTVDGTVFGPISSVKLFYSTDGVIYPNPLVGCATVTVVAGAFSCAWSVPDQIGTTLKVRVEDAGNALVFDTSDGTFGIKGSATITAPVGSSVWVAGDPHTIIWDRNGTIGNVDLTYSVNGGSDVSIATVPSPLAVGNTFPWTLPSNNIVSANVKVKIDGVNLLVPAITPDFTVKGKLSLIYPDAANIDVTLGDTINITWNAAGDIGLVKVEYAPDGVTFAAITTTAPQNGPFSLLLDSPNTTTATAAAKVRVTDADDAAVTDTSANPFMVRPLLAITSPTGGETWIVNSSQSITWNFKASNVTTVKIEYSNDNFVSSTVLFAGSTANDGTQPWTIPDDIQSTANLKVKISSLPTTDSYAVTTITNGLFKIAGSLTLTTPSGTDKWGVGTSHDIKWTRTGSIANVRLSYSTDGTNYNSITDSYPGGSGDTGYSWTIPNVAGIVSTNVTVRLADVNDATVLYVSPIFKITPSFTVTAPIVNERVTVKRQYTIAWDRQGLNPTVNLYYSLDGFTGPGISIAAAAANTGTYDWAVPDFAGLATGPVNLQVRVTYPDDETAFDDSPTFRAVAGFTVVAPNSTVEKWDVGSNQTILWTCTSAFVPEVKVEYSVDGGGVYAFSLTPVVLAGNSGASDAQRSFVWNPVADTITSQFKVRIIAGNDAGALDESDFNGKIKAFFQVLTPSNPSIVLKVDQSYGITWTWNGTVPAVRLDYSTDNFAVPANTYSIEISTTNDGTYTWIPVPDQISNTLTVRVKDPNDTDAFDVSDNDFEIQADFVVTAPNGADQFKIGFPHDITWDTHGTVTSVLLVAYSTQVGDPGFPYDAATPYTITAVPIANNANASTTYSWNPVPDLASTNVRVRVIDAGDLSVYDDSDADFNIQGSFTVTYPNAAGVRLEVADAVGITWNKTGSSITEAKISYSTTGSGGPWTPIQETEGGTPNDGIVLNDGAILWTVPDLLLITPAAFIKIEDPNDSAVVDLSDNAFKIIGSFGFVTPAGAERWVTNETQTVSWNTNGSVTSVDLVYSNNSFLSITPIVINLPNGAGLNSTPWTIPNDLSATTQLRLIDANDNSVTSDSNAFTIDHYQITFEVRDLLTNNFLDTLTVSASEAGGTYSWVASAQNAPIVKGLAAGSWTALFTRDEFGDKAVGFVSDQDQTVTVFMETAVVHIWEAITDLAYDSNTDTVGIGSTLRRDGITVPGAIGIELNFYDAGVLMKNFSDPTVPDANGFYHFTWPAPTGLISGTVYDLVTTITIATGGVFNTPRTFTVTQEKKLQQVEDTVNTKLDTSLSQVSSDIQVKLDTQSTTIQTKMDTQTAIIQNQMDTFTDQVAASIVSMETAATKSLDSAKVLETSANTSAAAAEELEAIALRQSGTLLMPEVVVTGQKVRLRYRNKPGLLPLIDILDTGNNYIVKAAPMTALSDRPEMYEYVIEEVDSKTYEPERPFQVIVTESTTGSLESAAVFVETARGRLLMPQQVLLGDTIEINFLGIEGWAPEIEILDFEGEPIVTKTKMTELPDKPGVFEYIIAKVDPTIYIAGKPVRVEVTESTTGLVESQIFLVEATSLTALQGLVAGQAGVKTLTQDALNTIKAVESMLWTDDGNVGQALDVLSDQVDDIPRRLSQQKGTMQMRQSIREVAERMKELGGKEGYDFSDLISMGVSKGIEESPTLGEIRETTDEVQGATEVMSILMDRKFGGVDEPVVHVILK